MYLQRLGNCLVLLPPVLMLQMLRMGKCCFSQYVSKRTNFCH